MGRPRTTPRERQRRAAKSAPIDPTAIYRTPEAARLLRIGHRTLLEEVKAGRIRFRAHGGHWHFQGQWLLDWFAAKGEPVAPQAAGGSKR